MTTHITITPYDIIVSKLDCIIARFPKDLFSYPDDFIWTLEDMLKGLGQHVETEVVNSYEWEE